MTSLQISKKKYRKKNKKKIKRHKKTHRNNDKNNRKRITKKIKSIKRTKKIQAVLSGGETSVGILVLFWGGGTVLAILVIFGLLFFVNEIVKAGIEGDKIMISKLRKNPDHYGTDSSKWPIGVREAMAALDRERGEELEKMFEGDSEPTYVNRNSKNEYDKKLDKALKEAALAADDWMKAENNVLSAQQSQQLSANKKTAQMLQKRWEQKESVAQALKNTIPRQTVQSGGVLISDADILRLYKELSISLTTVSWMFRLFYLSIIQNKFLDVSLYPFSFKTKTNKKEVRAAYFNLFKAWNGSKEAKLKLLKETVVSIIKHVHLDDVGNNELYNTLAESTNMLSHLEPEERQEQLQKTITVKINSKRINPFTLLNPRIGNPFKNFSLKELLKSSKTIKTVEVEALPLFATQ